MSLSGHIAVDLDGTLAVYPYSSGQRIGPPILPMLERVKAWLAQGIEVRIFTARACVPEQIPLVQAWCREHLGQELEVTNQKDYQTIEIWDDRAVGVEPNTGRRLDGKSG